MARRVVSASAIDRIRLEDAPPAESPRPNVTRLTRGNMTRPNAQKAYLRRFGAALSLDIIEMAMMATQRGNPRMLTDISRETINTDPHLAAILQKRFGTVSSLTWQLKPASGFGVDKDQAMFYAAVVNEQLSALSDFNDVIRWVAWARFDGRCALENTWRATLGLANPKYGNANLVLDKVEWIHPRRLVFGPHRELRIIDDSTSYWGNFQPVGLSLDEKAQRIGGYWGKFVQWKSQLFGDYPEWEGLALRCLYWSFFKRYSARDRMSLLELFGKPWRILEVPTDADVSPEDLDDADYQMQSLGDYYSARLPRGIKLNVVQPISDGMAHQTVIDGVDAQLSKLVLGQTGTTDGVPAGLNSNQTNVMQDEQSMILKTDAIDIAAVLNRDIVGPIIELNFGPMARTHAPKLVLRYDLPTDRLTEIQRLKGTLDAGLPVERVQAYEATGFRIPEDDEITVQITQPPTPPMSPVAPAPRPGLVYPQGASPPVGEQQPAAIEAGVDAGSAEVEAGIVSNADMAVIVKVNEARAKQGLGPLTTPDGQPDPDGELTLVEFKAKRTAKESEPDTDTDPDSDPDTPTVEATASGGVQLVIRHEGDRWVIYSDDGSKELGAFEVLEDGGKWVVENKSGDRFGSYDSKEDANTRAKSEAQKRLGEIEHFKSASRFEPSLTVDGDLVALTKALDGDELGAREWINSVTEVEAARFAWTEWAGHVCLEESNEAGEPHFGPESEWGSPERMMKRGVRQLGAASTKWSKQFAEAVDGLETAPGIFQAVNRTLLDLDLDLYARPLERHMIQSTAIGALDNATEIGDIEAPDVQAAKVTLATFSDLSFKDAIKSFLAKGIVTKAVFNQLSANLKRMSFTVAGIQSRQMLGVIHAELARQVTNGADLREFKKWMLDRLRLAGMIPTVQKRVLTASHIENVFRTNVLNSYNAGRQTHATQPDVLRRFPIWQIRVVKDNFTRRTHRAVDRVKLLATDPFWRTAYPPFGWNCRCRVVSRPAADMDGVTSGTTIRGLPDRGFTSGVAPIL